MDGWRAGPKLLLLLVFMAFSLVTDGSPLEVLAAPHVLQVGTPENIFVEIQDCTAQTNINVKIIVMSHPEKSKHLALADVTLNKANSWQAFGQIVIPTEEFNSYDNINQYVYLQAVFPNKLLEKIVLLSFRSEYLFIQTDKNIYTPKSQVRFRIFTVMNNFDDTTRMDPLDIEIVSPDGILPVDRGFLRPPGAYQGTYSIDENASPGLWKIVAKFSKSPQLRCAAEFKVKEYVTPALSVRLTPESSFFYVDATKLTVNIEAKYVFGPVVEGMAFVLFGIRQADQKTPLPSSLQRVSITGGNGAATLWRGHITQTFADIQKLMGSSIYVTVTVLTETGADMVEAELNGIKILTSPYSISVDKTIKYFKPGLPFDLEFQVLNPDNTPAKQVRLVVEPGTVTVHSGANGIAKLPINTEETTKILTITIKTRDPAIAPHRQAAATLQALPYTSTSKSYIHLVANAADVKLGDNLQFYTFLKRHEYTQVEVTYLILSKDRLVNFFRWQSQNQMLFISKIIPVTKEMIPSFGIIAYYHTSTNEVVSDSLWVDVKDSCLGSLRVERVGPSSYMENRRTLQLKITGAPRATVELVIVDKGLYTLNDRQGPTQKKIWDAVKELNKYCTPGAGKDSMSVFYNAGLMFMSSAAETPYKQALKCHSHNRRKRDIGDATEADESYMDDMEIVSRTHFPGSWLWTSVVLPSCPNSDPHCETTSTKTIPVPDSMTSSEIIAISQSQTHGICVADPLEFTVRKNFFIDLKLPSSAVAGKQLEIKAVLHNLETYPITVLVHFFEEIGVCSLAYRRGKYQQEVQVQPQSSRSVPFVVIFTEPGQRSIEVKAAVRDSVTSDGIRKNIQVLPSGHLMKPSMTVTLDPLRKGVDGRQVEILNSQLNLEDKLLLSPTTTVVYVTGEMPSLSAESVISGIAMDNLFQEPSGSGEVNMILMTLPVIATVYLDKTSQWEIIGLGQRNKALEHIKAGYRNQLAYRKTDGSFSASPNQPSSTWLTAYVAKVFTMASSLVSMDINVICDAIKFLILNRQQLDGQFREDGSVNNRDMTGQVFGPDSDASLTSFCLVALQESRQYCTHSINSLPQSILRAVSYLERRLHGLVNPYAVALASYALANENKLNKELLFAFAAPGRDRWPVANQNVYQLEATAYALLALIKAEALEEARPVVSWLRQQRRVLGGYGSTQATMMVYQAVAEYSTRAREEETKEYDLFVEVQLPGRLPSKYWFKRHNYHMTRILKGNVINRDITVTATGKGRATLKVVSLYYAVPKETEPHCQKFYLSVQLIPVSSDEAENVYTLKIDVVYLNKDRDTTMAVLDIGFLTGFSVNINDLNLLSQGRSLIISKYKKTTDLERGSLLIYLDKVSHGQPQEITFRIHQKLKYDVFQPAAVSVYEYDDLPGTACVKFYHPERKDGQLTLMGEEMICAEVSCCVPIGGLVSNEQRVEKSCEVSHEARTAFVYKVRLEEFTGDSSIDVYKMTILLVIREGNYDMGAQGKLRIFFSQPRCRKTLNLVKGKTYLVMGVSRDIYRNNESCHYALSDKTWLEYWPTDAECQDDQHRPACLGIEDMVQQQLLFGCTN